MKKTLGELIDELGICNQKIWALVERVEKREHTLEDAVTMQELVKRRSKLRNAINELFGEWQDVKVYSSDRKEQQHV
jgi:hypothetical protein